MKRKLIIILGGLAASIVLVWGSVVCGNTVKIFNSDGVIQTGESYDRVEVYDTPPLHTTVNMGGGSIGSPGMFTYDESTVNISGGIVDLLYTYHSSTVNISGGGVGGPYASVNESSTINIFGGLLGIEWSFSMLELYDRGTLNVDEDGIVGALTLAKDASTVNVYKGYVHHLSAMNSSTVNIYGGEVGSGWGFHVVDSSVTVNIYGYDFVYDPHWFWAEDNPIWGTGWVSKLTGYGFQDVPIKITGMPDPATNPNIHLIPEPSAVTLFAIVGLFLFRRRDAKAFCIVISKSN